MKPPKRIKVYSDRGMLNLIHGVGHDYILLSEHEKEIMKVQNHIIKIGIEEKKDLQEWNEHLSKRLAEKDKTKEG